MTRRSAMYYTVGQAVLACSAALSWDWRHSDGVGALGGGLRRVYGRGALVVATGGMWPWTSGLS